MASRWHQKAMEFTKLGRLNVAIHCIDRALEAEPRDAGLWLYKGITLQKLGRHEEAIECYDKAIEINPCHATAWFNKGAALGNQFRYREAVGCFDEAARQGHPSAVEAARACRDELGKSGVIEGRSPSEIRRRTKSR